ncbi:HK97 family phage prohead protease [Microbacterium oleivorans]|uniref:Prohead serine protease domain-containing protein n=1 Tax=Microbacterium oleivorans TaxID=273677 RepID=A0A4R5YGW4_9MICO|nr:HK97 family phage prohead protease [Microbacterium oleivorans]TDL43598.1 hypothetical protein E2R54_10315 [Microbacterium oleivorans]
MTELEVRNADIEYREADDHGYLEGIAVPYGQVANIGGQFQERFESGSVEPEGTVWLYHQHKDPIGVVEHVEHRSEGFFIRAKLALSDLAVTTRELLKIGALKSLSVGFVPTEHREEDGVRVITRARLREVSVVARPAYSLATVLSIREDSTDRASVTNHKEDSVMTDSQNVDLTEVRSEIEEIRQELSLLPERLTAPAAPAVDTRSAASFLVALAKGDETAIRSYNEVNEQAFSEVATRAYTGGTTADAPLQNQWVGDLTRIFDNSSGVLSETFSRGTLPAKGFTLEYAKLLDKTGTVQEQVNEGDDLAFMKVRLTTATAEVKTYGGRTQLSFQAIERSTLPLLQRNLEHMAVEAGVNKKVVLRNDFDAVVAGRRGLASNAGVIVGGAALGSMDFAKWLAAVLEAERRFKSQGYSVEKLIVTPDVFAHLLGLTTTGDRILRVAEGNSAGTANVRGLTASLLGIPVEVDDTPSTGAATGQAVFVNGAAIRQYDSAYVSLQDSNIVNLTKDFSIYRYGAIADEQPNLVLPVKFAAS